MGMLLRDDNSGGNDGMQIAVSNAIYELYVFMALNFGLGQWVILL